jgi:hypothetical protein
MIEFEHSPLGGSGAKRWLKCGTSFLLQRLLMLHGEYEEPPTSAFAEKGTAAHILGAECLTEDAEPFEYIGEVINGYTVHPDDLDPEAVSVYVNYCNAIRDGGRGDPTARTFIEKTFDLREVHPLLKGTIDFGHWRLQRDPGLWLVDYKNGEGIGVEAFGNEQLLYYAVLLVKGTPELQKLPFDFPVYLGIVQPNYWGTFDEPEIWKTDIRTVHDFAFKQMLPAMERLLADKREMLPEDEFVSGDHCQFCPVMLDCPKLRHAFETLGRQDEFIEMLKDEEISALFALREDARRYGSELEKVVFARKLAGRDIPTAKLVEKQTRRIMRAGAEAAAVARFGNNAYNPAKLKSPAQFEKLSSDGKAFALEWGFKPEADRLTVAPLSDRRAEAKPVGNAQVFKNFATAPVPLTDLGW